ncbi:MAG TPA: DUF1653 domain-containing protein [Candidatus Saccharibacteria bacterium]|nr:DUF1653 domain-containing protein [Candidatus Saccharibacteria bacterium]HMT39396.1 DUF1653 domain-containing protein [Candidatus Saccharibacteria bacterium]
MVQIKTGKYQHYKGNKYLVLCTAKHSETLEDMVVYVSLYDNSESQVWVRPTKMFSEMVEYKGKMVQRFKYLES